MNKKVLGVIDVKLLFIFIILIGMFYFHLWRLPWVALAEDTTRQTETFVKMIVENPPPMPVLQIEHEKEYSSDNTGYTMVNCYLT